ncbi:hypothetical protein HY450_02550 [Candidatus Pacearchaeota archaeon]|nr:hypothetical protein [Candidatus Pacearchaeota archaeon]
MSVDDILNKVSSDRERLTAIRGAMNHPSLSSSEKETLKREECRITGQDYGAVKRSEEQARNEAQMNREIADVNMEYLKKRDELSKEWEKYGKVVPPKYSRTFVPSGVPHNQGTHHIELVRERYTTNKFGKSKELKNVERKMAQLEEKNRKDVEAIKKKHGK